jgi:hypothetical protein
MFSVRDFNQNYETEDLVERTGFFFRKVAYSRYDVTPTIIQSKYSVLTFIKVSQNLCKYSKGITGTT